MNDDHHPHFVSRDGYIRGSNQARTFRSRGASALENGSFRSRVKCLICVAIVAVAVTIFVITRPRLQSSSSGLGRKNVGYDLYVMVWRYPPEFCFQHRFEDLEGCAHPEEFWRTHLTISGMWPAVSYQRCVRFFVVCSGFWSYHFGIFQKYLNGRTAENCGNQTLSESTIEPIRSRLLRYWPDISKRDHLGLWEEAWEKHGTCSGLSQLEYFEEALDNLLPAPFIIRSTYGSAVQRQEIDQEYNNKAVLICNHRQWFKEVRLCFSRTPDGIPTVAVDCPEEIKNMDSCARIVQLSQFP